MTGARSILVAAVTVVVVAAVGAQTARDEMADAHILGTSEYTTVKATMDIHGSRGVQTRRLDVYIQRLADGSSRILAQIVWPAFLSNMKYLTHSDGDGGQERWMKTSRGVRRLSNANFQDTVFNSDFTVEDFSYLSLSDYRFSYGAPADGLAVVDAQVLDPDAAIRRKVFRIDPAARLIREIDYEDATGAIVRRFRTRDTRSVDGIAYPLSVVMEDLVAGTMTVITIDTIDTRSPIPPRLFNRAGL